MNMGNNTRGPRTREQVKMAILHHQARQHKIKYIYKLVETYSRSLDKAVVHNCLETIDIMKLVREILG